MDTDREDPNLFSRTWTVSALKEVEFYLNRSHLFSPPHVHNDFNLDLVQAGVVEYSIGDRTFVVIPGTLVWIARNEVHGAKSLTEKAVLIRSFFITEEYSEQIAAAPMFPLAEPLIRNEVLARELQTLHTLAEEPSQEWEVESLFLQFFSSLISRYSPHIDRTDFQIAEHKAVHEVRDYLQQNYCKHISLNILANIVGLNVCYLVRLFQKYMGIAPYRYLTQLRIVRASELLAKGMEPANVALEVGLSDQSHLTRLFKRTTGLTPGSYVRTHRSRSTVLFPEARTNIH